ncbi:peptidoglycan-binding domain-containing protein [Fictibacillus sp. KU28468]|uniref:peptidoglycan-binding domain-containing protein n=1 Tax=Fictibacillus sp. KU28468 TaxID=2991053 RepID=UPI0006A7DCED|nr:peptidoglycan-binding protein [Fictibacillus sp. KU28468]UZJ79481.1 peptidoglycan-binding protein [Fictibacillus sp. KU28468]
MKPWKKVTASVLTASALLMGAPSIAGAQEKPDYSIFQLPKSGVLKAGDRGENVKVLQWALNKVVDAGLKTDGIYGSKTKNAVIKFQKSTKNLAADGIYGKKTHAALSEKINSSGFPEIVLKEGSKGEAVRILQKALNEIGSALTVDGIYGPKTKAAVLTFQKKYPEVKDTGVFDADTRILLDKVLHD